MGAVSAPKHCLPPVVNARTRVLVLGSLPGEVSLQRAQYYGHPRNLFWPLVGDVIGRDLVALAYEQRLAAILAAGVGVWDVVGSAQREGSLDAAIRDHQPNDLSRLIQTLPALRAIGFNGSTAARIGRPQLVHAGLHLVLLPSSSPAYASMRLTDKRERWRELASFL